MKFLIDAFRQIIELLDERFDLRQMYKVLEF